MKYSCLSDIGLYREKNQDQYFASTNSDGVLLALVADGVGGVLAGEVASKMVVDYFEQHFTNSKDLKDKESINNFIKSSISEINEQIFNKSNDVYEYHGMCTTITGIVISKEYSCSFNIGDSRVYGVIAGKLEQLTQDDSYVADLIRKGQLSEEEAKTHPQRNVLTKALGASKEVSVKINDIGKYEYYLVCSDGLYGLLSNDELIEVIANKKESLKAKTSELISLALLKGGFDNITVVLVK